MRVTTASKVQPGQVVLIDPLDHRTAANVVEVERSQYTSKTQLTMIWRGVFLTSDLPNDREVTVV